MPQMVSASCCECGNCLSVCPHTAITLQWDAADSCHALIDPDVCLDCHLCSENCPMMNPLPGNIPIESYGALSRSSAAVHSSSGGMFPALAQSVMRQGGLVSGAAYSSDWSVSHILIKDPDELIKLQGSKYVRSDVTAVFPQIKTALQDGKTVLFSGTPCQAAALQRFIQEPDLQESLITVDLICHGTPPASLFKAFLSSLEKKYHGRICKFTFRDKSFGNKLQGTFTIQNGTSKRNHTLYSSEVPYYSLFLKGLIYTEGCYSCPYAAEKRCGDITIGDFWGWQQEIPDFAQRFGLSNDSSVSAVMINTQKGHALFQQILPDLAACPVSYEQIKRHNAQLCAPVQVDPSLRSRIWSMYTQDGYDGLVRIHKDMTDIRRYSARLAAGMPSGMKALLKKALHR